MGTSAVIDCRPGAVVLVPFPFSDLSNAKLRPALVIASAGRGDWICAQITSNPYADPNAIELRDEHFHVGSLQRISFLRPAKLFTANHTLFRRIVGMIDDARMSQIRSAVISIISNTAT